MTLYHPKCAGWTRKYSLSCLGAVMAAWLPSAQAGTLTFAPDFSVDYALTLTYSAAMRIQKPDDRLTGVNNAQGNDGDNNFNKYAMVNNRGGILGEVNLHYQRMGVMLRGNGFYDEVYRRDNDNDGATVNKSGSPYQFTEAARRKLGGDGRLLDAYAYATLPVAGTALSLRVGRQVVSWGESMYFPNMSGSQAPADATKSTVPGIEVKDILLPSGQAYANWSLTNRFSLMGYYQWEWKNTDLVPVGGYFSTTDLVGPGAEYLSIPALAMLGPLGQVPYRGANDPGNGGQWGVATKYRFGEATDVGAYYLTYHDKNPAAGVTFGAPGAPLPPPLPPIALPSGYQTYYADHIRMGALSVSTDVFGTAVAGEVSYRHRAGIVVYAPTGPVGAVVPSPTRGDVWQANLNATKLFLPTAYWDTLTVVGEISWMHTGAVEAVTAGGTNYADIATGRDAGAYQFMIEPAYKQVFPGWDIAMSVIHANQFKNRAPIAGALGSLYGEGDWRLSVGPKFTYLANLQLQLLYNGYYGSPEAGSDPGKFAEARPMADRNYVSFSAKYSF